MTDYSANIEFNVNLSNLRQQLAIVVDEVNRIVKIANKSNLKIDTSSLKYAIEGIEEFNVGVDKMSEVTKKSSKEIKNLGANMNLLGAGFLGMQIAGTMKPLLSAGTQTFLGLTAGTEMWSDSLVRLMANFNYFKFLFGSAMMSVLEPMMNTMSGLFDWFNNLDDSTRKWIAGISIGIFAISAFLGWLALLTLGFQSLFELIKQMSWANLISNLDRIKTIFITTPIGTIVQGWRDLSTIIASMNLLPLVSSFALIVIALGLIAGATWGVPKIIEAEREMNELKGKVDETGEGISMWDDPLSMTQESLRNVLNSMFDIINLIPGFSFELESMTDVWIFFGTVVLVALITIDLLLSLILQSVRTVVDFFRLLGSVIRTVILNELYETISKLESVGNLIESILSMLGMNVEFKALSQLKNMKGDLYMAMHSEKEYIIDIGENYRKDILSIRDKALSNYKDIFSASVNAMNKNTIKVEEPSIFVGNPDFTGSNIPESGIPSCIPSNITNTPINSPSSTGSGNNQPNVFNLNIEGITISSVDHNRSPQENWDSIMNAMRNNSEVQKFFGGSNNLNIK